jgi:hypothetical protein
MRNETPKFSFPLALGDNLNYKQPSLITTRAAAFLQ